MDNQLLLPLGPVRNSELFSNHWLQHRLPLEPEWVEFRGEAEAARSTLLEIWSVQRLRVEKYGIEATLEQAFIQPVFEALGWKLLYQTYLQGREPDYALFGTDAALDAALAVGKNDPSFWVHPTVVADAKAWHVSIDKPITVGKKREYPPEQIEWYVLRSECSYGILTNGRLWRLVPRVIPPGKPRFQTYFQVDLPALLESLQGLQQKGIAAEELREFLYFFLFLSPRAFHPLGNRTPLVQRALLGSSEYAVGVTEDLRERVFEALRLCTEGFLKHAPNALSPDTDLRPCQENSFILLYRLLFVMYAEDRGLLPYRRNTTYTNNRSLARLREEISDILNRKGSESFSRQTTAIWESLGDLFDLVDRGHKVYGVPPYNGGLFTRAQHVFLQEKAISDHYLAQVIDQLSRIRDPKHPGVGLFRVDYRDLAIRQLGAVYEGLLELQPRFAEEAMVVARSTNAGSKSEIVWPASKPLPKDYQLTGVTYARESIYLETDKGERRATGSYYTPDHIVNHIVEQVLRLTCEALTSDIERQIEEAERALADASPEDAGGLNAQVTQLRSSFDEKVLTLRVLDPAMGSGHFLVRACQYLAEEIATNPYTGDPEADKVGEDGSTLAFWKRRVAEQCIYGVDLNPLAVELAKLALWLETVATDQPLTFLDHRLRCGNSLVGAEVGSLGLLSGVGPLHENAFSDQFQKAIPSLLEPLFRIRSLPSQTPEEIKQKEALFARQFLPRREPYCAIADLWVAAFFADELDGEHYRRALELIDKPRKMQDLLMAEPYSSAIDPLRRSINPFHWELQFPEVYFAVDGRRGDAGFDAIIGNPPYDVLASKEVGADLTRLTSYFRSVAAYSSSFVGKNNLYKLFMCRAVALLKEGGRLGFIVPMALLGDLSAVGIRKLLFQSGRLTEINAFPQKDDPKRRVFPEAKLATVLVGFLKDGDERMRREPFVSRVHSGAEFDADAPKLVLSASEVPLYDPENLTIVSCTQDDWNLAVRMMRGGQLDRLGKWCVSYQGEVNEKTDSEYLSENSAAGPQVLRGAHVSLYAVREATQGSAKFLKADKFLRYAPKDSKAWQSREARVGFQRSSPQNNFRRIIAAPIQSGSFCFDTVSYVPASKSRVPENALLALLNSQLLDWYFRLGSTNSKVNEYQFNNLPCPVFTEDNPETECAVRAKTAIDSGDYGAVREVVRPLLKRAPIPRVVRDVLEDLVERIRAIEVARGPVPKRERSALAPAARPLQALIDQMLFELAGFSAAETDALLKRLENML